MLPLGPRQSCKLEADKQHFHSFSFIPHFFLFLRYEEPTEERSPIFGGNDKSFDRRSQVMALDWLGTCYVDQVVLCFSSTGITGMYYPNPLKRGFKHGLGTGLIRGQGKDMSVTGGVSQVRVSGP